MSGERPPANRMTLQTFKGRLGGAKKGHSLLKKKRDALKARFQMILKDIVEVKLESGQSLKDGAFALAKANWASTDGDISSMVIERASVPSVTCKMSQDNIAGVPMPKFTMQHDPAKDVANQTLGVGHGGAVINATRVEYQKAVFSLVKLASLQTMFITLDLEIKMTSRRVNALEYVLIPKIVETVHYITQEMDEMSREEFFRVKKVVEKKKQRLAAERLADANFVLERQLSNIESGESSDENSEDHQAKVTKTVSNRLKMPHKRGSIMTTNVSDDLKALQEKHNSPKRKPADPPAAPAPPVLPQAGPERRTDPADGKFYTFEELKAYYAGKYNAKQIAEYWASIGAEADVEASPSSGGDGSGKKSKSQKRRAAKAKASASQASGTLDGKDEDIVFS